MATVEGLLQAGDGDRQEPIAGTMELKALEEGPQGRGERRRNCVWKLRCDCNNCEVIFSYHHFINCTSISFYTCMGPHIQTL